MKRILMVLALVACLLPGYAAAAQPDDCSTLDRNDAAEIVHLLAHPALGGRGTDEPGFDAAGIFLARELRTAGFLPLPGMDGYFQSFVFYQDIPDEANSVLAAHGKPYRFGADFLPFPWGRKTLSADGAIAFAGYGITAPEEGYDDYAGIDASGKVVVILRHEPRENGDDEKIFRGKEKTPHYGFGRKVENAVAHGAIGIIFVEDAVYHGARGPIDVGASPTRDRFAAGTRSAAEWKDTDGIPVVSASVEAANELIGASTEALAEEINSDLKPRSFIRDDTAVRVVAATIVLEHRSRNVVGYLPGGTQAGEFVILGAHYDHLGTLPDGTYLGANDNASGTAGVLAAARALGKDAAAGRIRERSIVVAFWGAEEWGLQGSLHFAQSETLPDSNVIAAINLDMIGRNDPEAQNWLFAMGAEKNSEFPTVNPDLWAALRESNAGLAEPFDISLGGDGDVDEFFMRTDSGALFIESPEEARLPIVSFSAFSHEDYHAPTDTPAKIDFRKVNNVACLVLGMARRIADNPARPRYLARAE